MHVKDNTQVLPIFDSDECILATRVVPLPIFLVPLFINGGTPFNTIKALQAFMDKFVEKTTKQLTDHVKFIFNLLRAATGFNEAQDNAENPESQLTIKTTNLDLDDILMQWALTHFGGILQMAQLHDNQLKEHDSNNDNEGLGYATSQQTPPNMRSKQSQTPANLKIKKKQIKSPCQLYKQDKQSKQAPHTQQKKETHF